MAVPKKVLKRQTLRNIEYYGLQEIFDELYQKSLENRKFRNLMELILMEENIKLAYRNMKKNDGSTTPGVDGKTIEHLAKMTEKEVIELVRNKLEWYTPKAIRRVEIDKGNGKKRPLGIASIEDRLIQQCILQVLEPICEAKFHDRSNGFRPNRGVENALAQAEKLIQSNKLYIVVDIDIKGFFDNVSHGKLLKQLWTIGIQDKKLISIISAMLKGEIAEIGFPEKGTAQGSIISPLLSNVVLNELDWWIASQWEFMPTRHVYKEAIKANGTQSKSKKYRALRNSTLKECFIVRYADDFKIFCRKHKDAVVMFEATKQWLKTRLGLDIGWKPSDLEQREGRIIRQGNHNKKVHIFRYVTESTFDSYMWQLIENKQKFISQIMTSKAPVRSCEDVDEAALSYAEVKALATGNPAVKEKMALDVDVAKLKLLKANHMNNQYRLEDDIARNFPQQIAKLTEIIDSYKADIAHYSEHKSTDPEQFTMEIGGKVFTEKKEAGAALLAVCKDIKTVDAAMDIGNYQGFNMRIQFDGWSKEFILSVKHEAVSKVHLGADALGNITRINNLLDSYPEKLSEAQQRLETVYEQMANAKEEVGKPFPKEEELNQKLERLSELNALLNMDEREDAEAEVSESDEKEERPARGSIHEKLQIYKEKSQRESETGKDNRKRDFGLE